MDLTSEITGVIAFGVQVLHLLYELATTVKELPGDVDELKREAQDTTIAFQGLERILEQHAFAPLYTPDAERIRNLLHTVEPQLREINSFVSDAQRYSGRTQGVRIFMKRGKLQKLQNTLITIKGTITQVVAISTSYVFFPSHRPHSLILAQSMRRPRHPCADSPCSLGGDGDNIQSEPPRMADRPDATTAHCFSGSGAPPLAHISNARRRLRACVPHADPRGNHPTPSTRPDNLDSRPRDPSITSLSPCSIQSDSKDSKTRVRGRLPLSLSPSIASQCYTKLVIRPCWQLLRPAGIYFLGVLQLDTVEEVR